MYSTDLCQNERTTTAKPSCPVISTEKVFKKLSNEPEFLGQAEKDGMSRICILKNLPEGIMMMSALILGTTAVGL